MSEPASDCGASTRARLTQLLAAVLWSSADHYADIYENFLLEAEGECPMVEEVELTEHSPPRLNMILAGGAQYTIRVEPGEGAFQSDGDTACS